MNTSVESLTHKMQRAAVGKMVDVVLSHADKDRQKTVGQLVEQTHERLLEAEQAAVGWGGCQEVRGA